MVERGPYVSYANCGLPYHVGGVIAEESSLLVATEQMFKGFFNVDVRTRCEVRGNLGHGEERPVEEPRHRRGDHREIRQTRALAWRGADPSAAPRHRSGRHLLRPYGARRPLHREWLDKGTAECAGMNTYTGQTVTKPKRAVVVGGGFIGLEMVENLHHWGRGYIFSDWTRSCTA